MLFSCTHLHPRGTTTVQTYAKYLPYPNGTCPFCPSVGQKGEYSNHGAYGLTGLYKSQLQNIQMLVMLGVERLKNPNRKIGVAAGKILDFSENMSTDDVGLTFSNIIQVQWHHWNHISTNSTPSKFVLPTQNTFALCFDWILNSGVVWVMDILATCPKF